MFCLSVLAVVLQRTVIAGVFTSCVGLCIWQDSISTLMLCLLASGQYNYGVSLLAAVIHRTVTTMCVAVLAAVLQNRWYHTYFCSVFSMPVWYRVETGKRSVAFLAPSFPVSPISVIDDKSHEGNAIKRMWKFKQTGDRYRTNSPTLTVPFIFLLNMNFRSAAWYISAMERFI
jgi:hypothetical protein